MPRKQVSQVEQILSYFQLAPLAAAQVVYGLVRTEMSKRVTAEQPPAQKKRQRVRAPQPTLTVPKEVVQPATAAETPKPRRVRPSRAKNRMRVDSQPPVNEATPLVEPVAEVGEDTPESYEGQ